MKFHLRLNKALYLLCQILWIIVFRKSGFPLFYIFAYSFLYSGVITTFYMTGAEIIKDHYMKYENH